MRALPAGIKKASIHIGGVFSSAKPAVVRTVLGSCVAACLFDPELELGGMNHFMLPSGAEDSGRPTRFGVHAMEVLINDLLHLGAERVRLQAKIFGGAHVLRMQSATIQVPERNIDFIRDFLEAEQIPVVGERLGGSHPLQIYFFTQTAKVWLKALRRRDDVDVASLAEAEGRYRARITQQQARKKKDNVTLF